MSISILHRRSILALGAIALLAACGGAQTSTARALPPNAASVGHVAAHGKSWMLPEAKNEDLLYVSNVYTITAYSYPAGKLVGTLSDFDKPYGLCVDAKGDVFVTDSVFAKIYEYPHGGTKPIRTLSDPEYVPYGCAVDPTSGNLAVMNYSDSGAREGDLAIYHKARGYPKSYISYGFYYYYYGGYDPEGNLYIDGCNDYCENFEFAELPKGKNVLKGILINQVTFPGGVQWDGKYIAIGNESTGTIDQFTIANGESTLEGSTSLDGIGIFGQFAIDGANVVVPNQFDVGSGSNVLYYAYPAGGSSTQTLTKGVFYPFATAISLAAIR
ncbi:MAG: hypothetical protein ABSD52_07400 [Candidatus Cybelea sp.]|jgi:hypothetical protein